MKLSEWLMLFKLYQGRALGLIAIITNLSIIYILLDTLDITPPINPFLTLLIGFVLLLIVGWLDFKVGFFSAESKIAASQNPTLMEILRRVKRIERTKR